MWNSCLKYFHEYFLTIWDNLVVVIKSYDEKSGKIERASWLCWSEKLRIFFANSPWAPQSCSSLWWNFQKFLIKECTRTSELLFALIKTSEALEKFLFKEWTWYLLLVPHFDWNLTKSYSNKVWKCLFKKKVW